MSELSLKALNDGIKQRVPILLNGGIAPNGHTLRPYLILPHDGLKASSNSTRNVAIFRGFILTFSLIPFKFCLSYTGFGEIDLTGGAPSYYHRYCDKKT